MYAVIKHHNQTTYRRQGLSGLRVPEGQEAITVSKHGGELHAGYQEQEGEITSFPATRKPGEQTEVGMVMNLQSLPSVIYFLQQNLTS